jgi:hypothetical protein
MVLLGYSEARGTLIYEKNLKPKISCQTPFKSKTCAVQLYLLAETTQLPHSPRIWAYIRGRYWSAKIDDISL